MSIEEYTSECHTRDYRPSTCEQVGGYISLKITRLKVILG